MMARVQRLQRLLRLQARLRDQALAQVVVVRRQIEALAERETTLLQQSVDDSLLHALIVASAARRAQALARERAALGLVLETLVARSQRHARVTRMVEKRLGEAEREAQRHAERRDLEQAAPSVGQPSVGQLRASARP